MRPHTGSGIKTDIVSGPSNPEKPQYEENKENKENSENVQEEKSLWQRLGKLEKGLLITSVVLILAGIVVGFTLLGLALSWKPKTNVNNSGTLSMPNSNQAIVLK